MWAFHARRNVVHFGNTTNNRLENANLLLKKRTHNRDSMIACLTKVWNHAASMVQQFKLKVISGCCRRLMKPSEAYMSGMLNRMTTYAAMRVLRQIGETCFRIPFNKLENQVSAFSLTRSQYLFETDKHCAVVELGSGTCTCSFYMQNWLPCEHILSAYNNEGIKSGYFSLRIHYFHR